MEPCQGHRRWIKGAPDCDYLSVRPQHEPQKTCMMAGPVSRILYLWVDTAIPLQERFRERPTGRTLAI